MDIELPSEIDLKAVFQIKRYLYLPVITVIVIIGLLTFFFGPTVQKILRFRKEISLASEELTALETKVEVLESFDDWSLLEQVEVLEQALPSRKDVFGLLTALNGLAADNEVALDNFRLSPGSIATETATPSATTESSRLAAQQRSARERKSGLESIAVEVNITGQFDGVNAFLSGVERSWPLMKLTRIRLYPAKQQMLAPSSTPSASFRLGADLELDLFYALLPTQLGAVSKPIATLSEAEQNLYDELLSYLRYEVSIPSTVVTGNEDLFSSF